LTTSYIYCINFLEHNGDVSPKSYVKHPFVIYRTVKEWVPSAQRLLGVCSISCYTGNMLLSLGHIQVLLIKNSKYSWIRCVKIWDHSFTFSMIHVAYSLLPSLLIKNVTICMIKYLVALKLRMVFHVAEDIVVGDVL